MTSIKHSSFYLFHVLSCCLWFFLAFALFDAVQAAPVDLIEQAPITITSVAPGVVLVDFGKVAFGNLKLSPLAVSNLNTTNELVVRFGEALRDGRIDRKPPGSVCFSEVRFPLQGASPTVVAPQAIKTFAEGLPNTLGRGLVKTPKEWCVLTPFRWVEIEGWRGPLDPGQVLRRAAFARGWNDQNASFESSDLMLNKIWELCRYSLKATTFAGLFVDGDRERTPYEADAYIDQIGCYYSDPDPGMARDTFDFLLSHPTWPTEWALHMIFILHADWMQAGDKEWLASRFDKLESKLLESRLRPDGLLGSSASDIGRNDIIDWPPAERDGYQNSACNTVVNAFYLHALELMGEMAKALGRDQEALDYSRRATVARGAFQEKFFDVKRGIYRDGEGVAHASAHANFIPLAFGLVPPERLSGVLDYLKTKGMPCSVYGAQYLLEGFYRYGQGKAALELMKAPGERSWRHMIESGATITWEAWDQKFKPNQDWNHAWGAAPANLLPRYVLGVVPAEPGWKSLLICPNPEGLHECRGKVPTPRGSIFVSWVNEEPLTLRLTVPAETPVSFDLPGSNDSIVKVNGEIIQCTQSSQGEGQGRVRFHLDASHGTDPFLIKVSHNPAAWKP